MRLPGFITYLKFPLLVLVCWLMIQAQAMAGAADRPLSFGVVPQQSASRLAEEWTPLLVELGRRSGVRLVFHTAPNIPAFEERLRRGEYDLAYMNPYHYAVFSAAPGYRVFARERDRRLAGIVVVHRNSRHRTLADLAGKTIALPAPAAFAASVLTQAEFSRLQIPIETKFVSSHDSVYRVVASGLHEAGGGVHRTLAAAPAEVRAALRIIAETPAYSPHAFAAHPRVPGEAVARVQAAMRALADDGEGRRLLASLEFKGLVTARDEDWDDIRALKLPVAIPPVGQ